MNPFTLVMETDGEHCVPYTRYLESLATWSSPLSVFLLTHKCGATGNSFGLL